ncbi:MAG: NADH-quinone oxidoreductase subunit A [Planctomycetota bacterium]
MNPAIAVLLFTGAALGLAIGLLVLSHLVGPRSVRQNKLQPYECGAPVLDDVRRPFKVHYYVVAVLFLLFDLEIAFFIPWVMVYKPMGLAVLVAMLIFTAPIVLGLVYEWRRGALEWD